jgi:hypothetical protein
MTPEIYLKRVTIFFLKSPQKILLFVCFEATDPVAMDLNLKS